MKKILILLLTACVLSLTVGLAAGCDQGSVGMGQEHEHDWGEWQITKHATCSLEGQKKRVCKSDPSHTETATIEIDPEAHDYGPWGVTREPTCSIAGEKTRTCRRDHSHKETAAIETDPEAHDFDAWEVTKEPTCSAAGERTRVCKRDQTHKETAAIAKDPEAHKWDEGKVTKEPSCKESGEKVYTCLYDSKHTKKEAIFPDASAHVLGEWIEPVNSTCAKNGVPGHYECKNCGTFFDEQKKEMKTTSLPLLDHEFITKEVKCGCELGSYNIELCKTCGKSEYRQSAKPKAHAGVNVCTDCGMNFIDAYKNYITSEGKYYESDSESAYRIVVHETANNGTYYQYQWWYQTDGTIKWMIYQFESIYSKTPDFEFDISWKAKDSLFDWELCVYTTINVMKGSLRPETLTESTGQALEYTSVTGFYLSEQSKVSMSKLACSSLQLLLAITDLRLVPPEGFSVANYGFTKITKPFMLHEYTVSSGTMDSNTHKGQLNFSCSHCSEKRTVEFDLDANAKAICAPATSDALHASPLEGETLFQERKFCLASDFKRLYKRRVR